MSSTQVDRDRRRALEFVRQERYDDALHLFESIVSTSDHPWDYLWRAHLNLINDNHSGALKDYEKVLEIDPFDRASLYHAALIYATSPIEELRNGARALELSRRAEQESNGEWRILALVAASYAECGDFDNALEFANSALRGAPQEMYDRLVDRIEGYRNNMPCRLSFDDYRIDEGDLRFTEG